MASELPPSEQKPVFLVVFGKAVRQYRTERGYSQEGFGDACGIDRSYIGGVERGERNLALANIMKIIMTLGMQPSDFFKALDKPAEDRLSAKGLDDPAL